MSFAETYLKRYATDQVSILPEPDKNLSLTIIIPVYNEPGLLNCLDSLLMAEAPGVSWEILLVINEPLNCPGKHHEQNLINIVEIEQLKKTIAREDLRIHVIVPPPLSPKKAGPGMARKIGMDEAIRRFNRNNRPDGLIVSYDADTRCASNYLKEINRFFIDQQNARGCTIYFEHPLDDVLISSDIHKEAIIQYELYLRYFKMSLKWAAFPYSCYALGSSFAVTAETYVKAGGMGLQQAGEDFYFLQKCILHGDFWELNTTTVYPSSRISDRVVFGTGPFILKYISEKRQELVVYPFEFFEIVKPLFSWINSLTKLPDNLDELSLLILDIPGEIRKQVISQNWEQRIELAYSESAVLESFIKRCYHEISLLQVIRLFNELIDSGYDKQPVGGEFAALLLNSEIDFPSNQPSELLHMARELEKARGNVLIN